ncbi:MAG: hypothetical protein IPF58_16290 [Saprospirales bacterium]|nr:hypothetical protein [Saprospirales bacterium]
MRKDNLINSVLILGSCILILTSCKHDKYAKEIKDASPYFTNFFTGTDDDILRNVNFNVSLDEVKKIEQAKLYETTADHLFYEFIYPKDSSAFSEYANVQYFFNENNQLDIITTDIYLNDSAQVAQTKKSFEQYYTKRYGKSERDEKGYDIWNGEFTDTKTKKDFNYSVALTELEEEVGIKIEYLKE